MVTNLAIAVCFGAALVLVAICAGYAMGRNSAGLPTVALPDPGPPDTDSRDPFDEAMYGTPEDGEEPRIPTL